MSHQVTAQTRDVRRRDMGVPGVQRLADLGKVEPSFAKRLLEFAATQDESPNSVARQTPPVMKQAEPQKAQTHLRRLKLRLVLVQAQTNPGQAVFQGLAGSP